MLLSGHGLIGELFETGDQGLAEAFETVAVLRDGGPLAGVEVLTDLFARVHTVIDVGDEGSDGALEVDVVFPKGVVGVEEKSLGCGLAGCGHAVVLRLRNGWWSRGYTYPRKARGDSSPSLSRFCRRRKAGAVRR